jgi:hypothetical protein
MIMLVLCLLLAILWPAVVSASATVRRVSCGSQLRQIGKAYQMYLADYGRYPGPASLADGPYLGDRRILFCPDDHSLAPLGAAASYHFRERVPPEFTPIWQAAEPLPSTVVVNCDHHLGQHEVVQGDATSLTPPRYPFHLVLHLSGAVERIHLDRIRTFYLPGDTMTYMHAYPGDPGYDQAVR